jgi:hypothetical protein
VAVGGAACGALAVAAGTEAVSDKATLMRRRFVLPAIHGGRRGGGSLYECADARGAGAGAVMDGGDKKIESEWEARQAARENRL